MHDALADKPDPAGALAGFVEQMSTEEVDALRSALRAVMRRSSA
jgi:hypothetical protein